MTIIALPAEGHDHLADALVRDLGYTRRHVDQPIRDLLVALDPIVDAGAVTMANRGAPPNLSSWLERVGGSSDEERWHRLLNPARPMATTDRVAAEVTRLLDVLRAQGGVDTYNTSDNLVIVGVLPHDDPQLVNFRMVAIEARHEGYVDHWITPAGVVGEQEQIVSYVRELWAPPAAVPNVDHIDSPVATTGTDLAAYALSIMDENDPE